MKVEVEGKEYIVQKPSAKVTRAAKLEANKVFKKCLDSKDYFLREELFTVLRERGYWDDEKDNRIEELRGKIREKELILEKGGIELDEAKEVALDIRRFRNQILLERAKELEFDSLTVEAQSDDAYFNYLVSECCFNEDGTKVFSSFQDYIDRKEEDLSYKLAESLSKEMFDIDDFERDLPENKFLVDYGFVDDNLNLIKEEEEAPVEEVKFSPFLKNGEPIIKE